MAHLEVLIPRERIAQRVAELGAEISRDFAGHAVLLVGVLKGAAIFLCDLARTIDPALDVRMDFIGVSSYGTAKTSSGEVQLTKDLSEPLAGVHVILVEDILDTGVTLHFLKQLLLARQPASLKLAALLQKPDRRKVAIQADYVGFTFPDEFAVGYGLDHAERYRNLPDICIVRE